MVLLSIGDKMLHCKPCKHAGAKEIAREMRITRKWTPLGVSQCDITEHKIGQFVRRYFLRNVLD